jgi:SAM-dependent methyltransferase
MPDVWDRYVPEYHDANPGITEDLLAAARDGAGRTPYDWLLEAVPAGASSVVDVACGSGPLGRRLAGVRVVGVDRSGGELGRASGPRVQAAAQALPLAGGCADAVVCSMALMVLHPLDAVLSEVARVLAPEGRFVATMPMRSTGTPVFAAILRDLGQVSVGYPEPLVDAVDQFSASGLQLDRDETGEFTRPVNDGDAAALVVRSFYAPGAGPNQVAAAVASLRKAVPLDVKYRLRRLRARR